MKATVLETELAECKKFIEKIFGKEETPLKDKLCAAFRCIGIALCTADGVQREDLDEKEADRRFRELLDTVFDKFAEEANYQDCFDVLFQTESDEDVSAGQITLRIRRQGNEDLEDTRVGWGVFARKVERLMLRVWPISKVEIEAAELALSKFEWRQFLNLLKKKNTTARITDLWVNDCAVDRISRKDFADAECFGWSPKLFAAKLTVVYAVNIDLDEFGTVPPAFLKIDDDETKVYASQSSPVAVEVEKLQQAEPCLPYIHRLVIRSDGGSEPGGAWEKESWTCLEKHIRQ